MIKPLLATSLDLNNPKHVAALKFPLLCSPKLDGIRFLITSDGPCSRSLKPIRNHWIREHLAQLPVGMDGEIAAIPEDMPDEPYSSLMIPKMNLTSSAVMSFEGKPRFFAHVFDSFAKPNESFSLRQAHMRQSTGYPWMLFLNQLMVYSLEELKETYELFMAQGYEGMMIRSPEAKYKFGRSTIKSLELLKLKLFATDEATILEVLEEQHNSNEAHRNAVGGLERSSAKAGMIGKGRAGALRVTHPTFGKFKIYGFPDSLKEEFWASRYTLPGKLVTFSHFPYAEKTLAGEDPSPRFPTFVSIRHEDDL